MNVGLYSFGIRLLLLSDGSDGGRRSLDGYPLHIMLHPSNATHFFTASRSARTTMNQKRKRRTMTCTFFCAVLIEHQDSSMMSGSAHNKISCETIIPRYDRTTE